MTYKKRVSEIKLNYGRAGRSLLGDGIRHPILLEAYSSSPATLRFLFAWQAERRALMGGVYSVSISLRSAG